MQDPDHNPPKWYVADNGVLKWGPPAVHTERAKIERDKARLLFGPLQDETAERPFYNYIPDEVWRARGQARKDAARAEIGRIQEVRAQSWAREYAQRQSMGHQPDRGPEII